MIFQVRREGKDTGSGGFFEPGPALDEALIGMVAGEVVTITPRAIVDEADPPPQGTSDD